MTLISHYSGASWIFEQQKNKLKSVLSNLSNVEKVEIVDLFNPVRQELRITVNENIYSQPNEIFNLGLLVQTVLN